jgi:hypothetical protein
MDGLQRNALIRTDCNLMPLDAVIVQPARCLKSRLNL